MRPLKQFIFGLSLIAALFGWSGSATSVFACSCAMLTPSEQFDTATVVFVGTVKSITEDSGENLVNFEISELRKGSDAENIVVATSQQSGTCGFNFEEGKEYVVYAYGEEGQLATGICSGTSLIAESEGDISGPGAENTINEPIAETEMDKGFITFTGAVIVVLFAAGMLAVYRRFLLK